MPKNYLRLTPSSGAEKLNFRVEADGLLGQRVIVHKNKNLFPHLCHYIFGFCLFQPGFSRIRTLFGLDFGFFQPGFSKIQTLLNLDFAFSQTGFFFKKSKSWKIQNFHPWRRSSISNLDFPLDFIYFPTIRNLEKSNLGNRKFFPVINTSARKPSTQGL